MNDQTKAEEIQDVVEEPEVETHNQEGEAEAQTETAVAEAPTLEQQLAAAQAEAEDYKDRWLRSQAEFANARKRMDKQRLDAYANATANVIDKLLPIVDDFERAMENLPTEIQEHSWLEGIQLVQRKLLATLDTFNVTPIEAVGQPFDPNMHEAITQEMTDAYESGVVCRVLQTGYKIGDRVIRPSLVVVAA
ncbi:MAG: nucleotide exchange factor GrpE [Anaerolineaceae bacterium]|nr:nucleotide exchange factor GrpE [Anaerolineaceae bacterium]